MTKKYSKYIFAVCSRLECNDEFWYAIVVEKKYFAKEGCLSDQHLTGFPEHFEQLMEGHFVIDGKTSPEEIYKEMVAYGLEWSKTLSSFCMTCDAKSEFIPNLDEESISTSASPENETKLHT